MKELDYHISNIIMGQIKLNMHIFINVFYISRLRHPSVKYHLNSQVDFVKSAMVATYIEFW